MVVHLEVCSEEKSSRKSSPSLPADPPGVVELQSQIVPVFVIRRHHRLQRAGVVASPAFAHVNHSVLAPAQLATQFGLACHKATRIHDTPV